jgi:hypothetical protein
MKKIIICAVLLLSMASYANTPVIDASVEKIFKESFPTVSDAKWYTYEDHYTVLFTKSEVIFRVNYDMKGKMLSYRKDYYSKDLCPFINSKIKQKFPGKEVYGVTEIKSDNGLNYEITLQDDKHWYKITSDATGTLSLENKMRKA